MTLFGALKRAFPALLLGSIITMAAIPAFAQGLNENCTVSVLNRTSQVNPDGSWTITDVPSGFGLVRARATCIENGVTTSGQSDLFTITAGVENGIVPFQLGAVDPIPISISVTSPLSVLMIAGESVQLVVTANYADDTSANVSSQSSGTNYTISNPAVATVTSDGLVTAVSSGTVIIAAMNEGAVGLIQIHVQLSGDTDNDGIPDDLEIANGLDPNNAVDALEDPDGDGLNNKQELVDFGTNPNLADTDSDGILDGEEVVAGADGFITSALLPDTDGDGIRDKLEITTNSDPTNSSSYNLAAALSSIDITPQAFLLTFNTILGEASRQITVTGHLLDGTTIDLTSTTKGTNYSSSNLSICNFGVDPGKIYAGTSGTCTVTASNNGFSAFTIATVRTFAPTALGFVAIPTTGSPNNVDVSGNYAFVAAGALGIYVVDVTNHAAPVIVKTLDTPGNANDVKIVGNTLFVADGSSGLRILDVTDPLNPVARGSIDTPGIAQDVDVAGTLAFVADGTTGLQVVDVSNTAAPVIIGTVDTPGIAKGVNVKPDLTLAAVADGASGVQMINISNPAAPVIIGNVVASGMDARDLIIDGNYVYLSDVGRSFTSIDISNPATPVILATTPTSTGGKPTDVVLSGRFAIGSEIFFVNGVPIIDVSTPQSPIPRAILDFSSFRDDNGTGIAVDGSYVYLTATRAITENAATADGRLYIGQYLAIEDNAGNAPTVTVSSPANGATLVSGTAQTITAVASDDVGIGVVHFLVNGQLVCSDTAQPYQCNYTVPAGVTDLTIKALAVDFGTNVGTSSDVVVGVSADHLPSVTINQPISGSTVFVGTILSVNATATDDVGVTSVKFYYNGSLSSADTTAPYQYSFTVPSGISSLTIGAQAFDTANQASAMVSVVLNVTPDPGTTVIGVVRDEAGNAVQGAVVNCRGVTGTSSIGGTFSMAGVPTINSYILCEALLPGPPLRGISRAVAPVIGGTTDVGLIVVTGNPYSGLKSKTGRIPLVVRAADVNGDGKLDLVTANNGAQDISVLYGLGDSTFQSPVSVNTGGDGAIDLVLSDFNHDGILDIATANMYSGDISILLGNQNGSFGAFQTYFLDWSPASLAVGDFNGDGEKDLAVTSSDNIDVALLFGAGNGTFQLQPTTVDDAYDPYIVATADLNNDNKSDLITVNSGNDNVSVFLGNGDGTFQTSQQFAVGDYPYGVTIADLNADGLKDLAVANDSSYNVSVLLGNGNGTFQTQINYGVGIEPESLQATDLNNDGKLDLVVANAYGYDVSALLGNGNGTFQSEKRSTGGGYVVNSIVSGDFNNDGIADVAFSHIDDLVSVLLGNGDGTFPPPAYATNSKPNGLVLADFNNDGALDAVTSHGQFGNAGISLLNGQPNGSFLPRTTINSQTYYAGVAVGDVNNDGKNDIIATNWYDIYLFLGIGNGTFQSRQTLSGLYPGDSIIVVDINNDSKLDIVGNGAGFGLTVIPGNGNGTFSAPQYYPADNFAKSVAVADLNGDGRLDILSAIQPTSGASNVAVLLANTSGTFGTPVHYPVATQAQSVMTGDLNNDGVVDVVSVNLSNAVSVFMGNGDGTFQSERRYSVGRQPYRGSLVDVNLDGIPDIVTANHVSNDISILLGAGNGTFHPEQRYSSGGSLWDIATGDLNGDSKLDLVTVGDALNAISVHLHR